MTSSPRSRARRDHTRAARHVSDDGSLSLERSATTRHAPVGRRRGGGRGSVGRRSLRPGRCAGSGARGCRAANEPGAARGRRGAPRSRSFGAHAANPSGRSCHRAGADIGRAGVPAHGRGVRDRLRRCSAAETHLDTGARRIPRSIRASGPAGCRRAAPAAAGSRSVARVTFDTRSADASSALRANGMTGFTASSRSTGTAARTCSISASSDSARSWRPTGGVGTTDAADYEHDNEKWSVPGRHGYRLVFATWSKVTEQPRQLLDELTATLAA